jgi:hypothetical protein
LPEESIVLSAKVVSNFVQDIENYGKNYRGGIQIVTTAREKRTILREVSNSTVTATKIKEQ